MCHKLSFRLFSLVAFALISSAIMAQTPIPGFNTRRDKQDEQIEKGVKSGDLTKRDAAKLRESQDAIDEKKKKFEEDGVVTMREKMTLRREQEALNAKIFNKKKEDGDKKDDALTKRKEAREKVKEQ
jgi:hypothetical protein